MFTVQAVKDCVLLIMPLDCLHKMHRHFGFQYNQLFRNSAIGLFRML
jgi:hypothetical protein